MRKSARNRRKWFFIAALAIVLLGTAGVVAVYVQSNTQLSFAGKSPSESSSASPSDSNRSGSERQAPEPEAPARQDPARNVGGQTITSLEIGPDATIERIEPRQPLAPAEQEKPEEEETAALAERRVRLLHRPVATAAGAMAIGPYTITVDGVEPLSPDETCGSGDGKQWPCGMRARTAFRQYLRARAVRCEVPETDEPMVLTSVCTLAGKDIAQWLVERGWARASGTAYADLEAEAQEGKRGIYGSGQR